MSIVKPITDMEGFLEWRASRPESVQKMLDTYPPDRLYRYLAHRVTIFSYSEDGTVTVSVTGEYNRVIFSRNVFGIDPALLTECDPPAPGEDVGDTAAEAGYDEDDIRTILIPKLRQQRQPQ